MDFQKDISINNVILGVTRLAVSQGEFYQEGDQRFIDRLTDAWPNFSDDLRKSIKELLSSTGVGRNWNQILNLPY